MTASFGSRSDFDLGGFLRRLLSRKQSYQSIFSDPSMIPPWAAHCTYLLYCFKSVPTISPEANQLYFYYLGTIDELGMLGETHNKKRIDRTLKVKSEGSSVIVKSTHMNLQTNHLETFEGKGCGLEAAINDYFSKSDLRHPDYKIIINNIQKEGDAFLLHNTINQKGYNYLVAKIIDAVKELFQLVPLDKHFDLSIVIEDNFKNLSKILNTPENIKIFNHYDPRLWVIVESICNHFDDQHLNIQRRAHRDHVIAQCCTGLMKGINIFIHLEHYVSVLKMHNELMQSVERNDLHDDHKILLSDYQKQNLIPEIMKHRDRIKEYFDKHQNMGPTLAFDR